MKNIIRLCSLLLITAFLLALLPACKSEKAPLENNVPLLKIDGDEVTATVQLDGDLRAKHKGSRAYLYELKPGDTVKDLRNRDPLDNCKIKETMTFSFPLNDGNRTRLYSSFAVVFNDGSVLNSGSFPMISNPQALATIAQPINWTRETKGLVIENPDDAAALGASQGMIKIPLSALSDGETQIEGTDYYVSANTLAALNQQIKRANEAGVQVSLTVVADKMHPAPKLAALIDYVIAKCTADGATIRAIFIERTDAITNLQLATICRFAYIALVSRIENSRIFVLSNHTLMADAVNFFEEIANTLNDGYAIPWGAAVKLAQGEKAPWQSPESQENLNLLVANFNQFVEHLYAMEATLAPKWLAVCDLAYSAEDEQLQAASFAYTYRALKQNGANLIFYGKSQDDVSGLYAADGTPRRIASVFSTIDTGLSASDIGICQELAGASWDSLQDDTHPLLSGAASTEYDAGGEILFDFSDRTSQGFSLIGTAVDPTFEYQSGFGTTIPQSSALSPSGIRKVLDSAQPLKEATMLTVQTTVGTSSEKATLTLILDSLDENGNRITYRSTATLSCNEAARTAFHINSFASEVDANAPVVMSLTVSPVDSTATPLAFVIDEICISELEKNNALLLTLILISACILLTSVAFLLIHRRATAKARRRRHAARTADHSTTNPQ